MVPAGYLLKRTPSPPEWLDVPNVTDVCSVADCVSGKLVDIEAAGEHNAFGLAHDPEVLWRFAREGGVDTSEARLFYYEAYEQEIESGDWQETPARWRRLTPVISGKAEAAPVDVPEARTLLGYDVVVVDDYLDHSPLSCNSVAASVSVNSHCLFDSLAQARAAIEAGHFNNCEPGVYRIYSVYLVGSL